MINMSQNESCSNTTCSPSNVTDPSSSSGDISYVLTCIIIAVSLPVTLVTIYAVYSLVRKDHVAPIYVINLLVSDVIQLCCMIFWVTNESGNLSGIFFFIYYYGLMASVGFMVCVAMERYLVIAWPLWYHFRKTIKISLMVCVVVWVLPLIYLLPYSFGVDFQVRETIYAVFLLCPCPLLIFFLGGTLKALSAATRVAPDEKRRIVAMLVLVLLTYTLLFVPSAIWSLAEKARENHTFNEMSYTVVLFSPLVDCFLYVLLRKGVVDKVLASLCCCRMDSNDGNTSAELE